MGGPEAMMAKIDIDEASLGKLKDSILPPSALSSIQDQIKDAMNESIRNSYQPVWASIFL